MHIFIKNISPEKTQKKNICSKTLLNLFVGYSGLFLNWARKELVNLNPRKEIRLQYIGLCTRVTAVMKRKEGRCFDIKPPEDYTKQKKERLHYNCQNWQEN